ncbi:hypothetical protein TNIN_1461 [Trichonephila inaurata madagascariensis]|uniref:Uncharacterized protein n=1 Tax=Trichonephila inaurata madagascariensis TaxID=2747483 RepID=A0A8X7BZH2_9ARAC|nr:hypothetical protein TNIN_1461 [Trichonephila inaurata madagascariensis]
MQYLLQSVEPHSEAESLVLSIPATAANYSKAIEQLKERFVRDDLQVQIYVRDLLGIELEVLGITDPSEIVKEREDLSDFREKMRILPEGRYEVELP